MNKIYALFVFFALSCQLFVARVVFAADAPQPHIAIDNVPAIGEGRTVDGHIWFESAAGDYADYAITMSLEVTRGDRIWGPKPTYATPSVAVDSQGFSCLFVTGGNDLYAERLYVYLIPSDFVPEGYDAQTKEAAWDMVIIDRYADGRVEIQQTEEPIISIPEPVAEKHPADTPKLSLCYSPYIDGLSPEVNSAVPLELMRWQLDLIHPYADTIRLFGVSGELEKIYQPAKEDYQLRVIAGSWMDSRYSERQIYAELDKLIELANEGYVDVAVVGSETIHRSDFSAAELNEYITYVRERITNKSIPVGTSDTAEVFLNNPDLVENCEVILVTIYPFFSNVTAENAAQYLTTTYDQVVEAAGGRPVIISESGWPTTGSPEGVAAPSEENAALLFEETYAWSRENNVEIVFFSEIDEAWKVEGTNADVGGHWGHFTSDGVLKDAYRRIYQSISADQAVSK